MKNSGNNTVDELRHILAKKEQWEGLYHNAEYEHPLEGGKMIEVLQIHLMVFSLAMDRTIAGGFNPLYEDERRALNEFWYELETNLRTALEMLNMGDRYITGRKYDPKDDKKFLKGVCGLNVKSTEELV